MNKKQITLGVILIYTFLNLKALYPVLFIEGYTEAIALSPNASSTGFLAIFIALFLNVAVILYFLKNE